jgi:predicted nucleic acid-binding protein
MKDLALKLVIPGLTRNLVVKEYGESVLKHVVALRKTATIELPDAIIAATALTNALILWTHNTKDFKKAPELQLFDPLSQ